MRTPAFVALWRHPHYDPTESRAAERRVDAQALRIGRLLPTLLEHRERNHFADRIAMAFGEEPRG